MTAPKPSEIEIEEAAKDLERFSDPGLRQSLLNLFKAGLIVDSGRPPRRRIMWAAAEISPRH